MMFFLTGLFVNFYTWQNIDFFVQRKYNNKHYNCEWVDKGWTKPLSESPSLTIFGKTKWIQVCVDKDK